MCRCICSDREECEPVVKESTQTKQFGFQASGSSFPSIFLSLKYHSHLCIFLTLILYSSCFRSIVIFVITYIVYISLPTQRSRICSDSFQLRLKIMMV